MDQLLLLPTLLYNEREQSVGDAIAYTVLLRFHFNISSRYYNNMLFSHVTSVLLQFTGGQSYATTVTVNA